MSSLISSLFGRSYHNTASLTGAQDGIQSIAFSVDTVFVLASGAQSSFPACAALIHAFTDSFLSLRLWQSYYLGCQECYASPPTYCMIIRTPSTHTAPRLGCILMDLISTSSLSVTWPERFSHGPGIVLRMCVFV